MTILLKNQSLTGQISLKASWGVQKGPRGSARWQATPGPEGGLGLHPACRDALLVGRVGSSDPPHLLLLPPPATTSILLLSVQSLQERLPQSLTETLTPVQRMHSAHETLHSTNGYKCVFKEIPGLSHISHRLTLLAVHMDAHTLTAMNMAMLADKFGENCCCWTLRFKKDCMNV